eukprot:356549-Prorocentrum_lima.AAC.1
MGAHSATVCLAGWTEKRLKVCFVTEASMTLEALVLSRQQAINPAPTSEVQLLLAQAANINLARL